MNQRVEVVDQHKCYLGESPVWDHLNHKILWVDIVKGEIHQLNTINLKKKVYKTGQSVGAVNLCSTGVLLVALQNNLGFIKENGENPVMYILPDVDVEPGTRFNDAKCDPAGNLWAGTMNLSGKKGGGKLIMLDGELKTSVKISQVSVSNGMAWSNDHSTFYYIDSRERGVVAYNYNLSTTKITKKRKVIRIPLEMGIPDGMTIDKEGMLWIALWKGGKITRWDPSTGRCLFTVSLPVSQVTSCTFGGENFGDLYITSARSGLTENELNKEPLAGSLFIVRNIGVKGNPPFQFKNNLTAFNSLQHLKTFFYILLVQYPLFF